MNQQTRNILFMVSSIAVIIGAAMPLFMLKMPWVPYIYAFGAAGMAVCRLTFRYKGKNFRLKRLYHILLSLFGSLFIFHVQRRSRLDYVAYRRRCPTIIYIDSHSASIKERRKISYSQTPPLPCPVALRGVAYKIGAEAKGKYISPSPLPCPVALRGVSVREYRGSARRAKGLKQKQ